MLYTKRKKKKKEGYSVRFISKNTFFFMNNSIDTNIYENIKTYTSSEVNIRGE